MRSQLLAVTVLLAAGSLLSAQEDPAEKTEAEKWAAEEALDAERLGQTDLSLSAVGHIQLAEREWSVEDREHIATVNAGTFVANKLLRKQGWVNGSVAFQVRLANPALLDWLRKNPSVKTVQAQGRLRVDGKYFLIEDCRPAEEKPVLAPPAGPGKRGGM